MATKKRASTKKGGAKRKAAKRRTTTKKPRTTAKKRTARARTFATHTASAEAPSCSQCVRRAIQRVCGSTPQKPSDKLSTLCAPCDQGVLNRLRQELAACSGRSVSITCNTSVGRIITDLCG